LYLQSSWVVRLAVADAVVVEDVLVAQELVRVGREAGVMPYRAADRRLLLRGDQLVAELACMIHTTYPLPRPGGLRHHQRELLPTAANRAEGLYLTRPADWTDRAGLCTRRERHPLVPVIGLSLDSRWRA
jgi:hypothetical protein